MNVFPPLKKLDTVSRKSDEVFRLRDPGLGLRLSDEQILRMLGAGELFLPEGVHYRPLRKALRGPGLWGKCRFPIDNDHDEL